MLRSKDGVAETKASRSLRIVRLEASNIGGKLAREVKTTDMSNLQAVLYLVKGARVMCTLNGWKKAGVFKGAQGTVYDTIYGDGQGPPNMPIAILVRFTTVSEGGIYRGHSHVAALDCKRTRFPLDLAYATAIHKPQGRALPLVSTREKGHSRSVVVFCSAFERATFLND